MKKYFPFILVALGVAFVVVSQILRNGMPDADAAITNLSSTFMLVGGGICVLVGIVFFFLRHDPEVW